MVTCFAFGQTPFTTSHPIWRYCRVLILLVAFGVFGVNCRNTAHGASQSSIESDFIKTCRDIQAGRLVSATDFTPENFPDDYRVIRLSSVDAVECVSSYLSFMGSLPPEPRAWTFGRSILWNLAEECRFRLTNVSYCELSRATLNQFLAREPSSPYSGLVKLALHVVSPNVDFDERDIPMFVDLLKTTATIESSIVPVDPRLLTSIEGSAPPLVQRFSAWLSAKNSIELEALELQEALAHALVRGLDRDAPSDLNMAVRANLMNDGPPRFFWNDTVRSGHISQVFTVLLRYFDAADRMPSLSQRIYYLLSAKRKLMRPGFVPGASPAWAAPMTVSYNSDFYLGRCGNSPGPSAQNSSSVSHHHDGLTCNYDGTPGYALFDLVNVSTSFRGTEVHYWIDVAAKLRGGFRKGNMFGGDENETTSIDYTLSGSIEIPQCGDIRSCNPLVWIKVTDRTNDPLPSAIRSDSIQAKSSESPDWISLSSDPLVFSRRQGPIEIKIAMNRKAGHIGACCEPDWSLHRKQIYASSPIPEAPLDAFFGTEPVDVIETLYESFFGSTQMMANGELIHEAAEGLPQGERITLAQQILASRRTERLTRFGPLSIEKPTTLMGPFQTRFANDYGKIVLVSELEELTELNLPATELESLRDALGLLTIEATARDLEPAREAYRSRKLALHDLDLERLIKTINDSIDLLIALPDTSVTSAVEFLHHDSLDNVLSDVSFVSNLSHEIESAAARNDRRRVITSLMNLRGHLRVTLLEWQLDMRDLANEITQIDPSLVGTL